MPTHHHQSHLDLYLVCLLQPLPPLQAEGTQLHPTQSDPHPPETTLRLQCWALLVRGLQTGSPRTSMPLARLHPTLNPPLKRGPPLTGGRLRVTRWPRSGSGRTTRVMPCDTRTAWRDVSVCRETTRQTGQGSRWGPDLSGRRSDCGCPRRRTKRAGLGRLRLPETGNEFSREVIAEG